MLSKIKQKKNTTELVTTSRYEEIIEDKNKIIKLLEQKVAELEKMVNIKKTFQKIEFIQNEVYERNIKKRGNKK